MTPRLGTDGNRIVYPIRGIVQGCAQRSGAGPKRRTLVYVAALVIRSAGHSGVPAWLPDTTLEAPITVLALGDRSGRTHKRALRSRAAGPDEQRGAIASQLLPTLFAAVLFGPLAAGLVGAASMLGDPGAHLAARPRSRAETEVGDLHEHAFHRWCCDGTRCAGHSSNSCLRSSGPRRSVACRRSRRRNTRPRIRGAHGTRAGGPIRDAVDTRSSLLLITSAPIYAPLVALLAFMYVPRFAMDARAVPRSRHGRAATVRPVPRAAPARRRSIHCKRDAWSAPTFSSPQR